MFLRFLFCICLALLTLFKQPVLAQYFWGNDPQLEAQNQRQAAERQRALDVKEKRRPARQAAPAQVQTQVQARTQTQAPGIPQFAYREAPQSGPIGFFKRLFGVREEPEPQVYVTPPNAPVFSDPDAPKQYGSARTVCVRMCDGAYAPINTGRRSGAERDKELCEAQCPGSEVKVFNLSNDDIETGRALDGQSYLSLPNANKYKTSFVPNCACRPQGKSWADFSQGRGDPTLRGSDTVL
jgi:hypothetical protein